MGASGGGFEGLIDHHDEGQESASNLSDEVGLPLFTYHPDPLGTGSVEASGERCLCCGRERGYIYAAPVYAEEELNEQLCPWCIADGSAAGRFGATYSDAQPLIAGGRAGGGGRGGHAAHARLSFLAAGRMEMLLRRRVRVSRQPQPRAPRVLDLPAVEQFMSLTRWTPEQWAEFVSDVYEPGGSPAIYHFVCRKCNKPKYGWDSD